MPACITLASNGGARAALAMPLPSKVRSIVLWGGIIPAIILLLALVALLVPSAFAGVLALALEALYPAQVARIALRKWRSGAPAGFALGYGLWMMLGKFAQFGGVLRYWGKRWRGGRPRLIEYKGEGGRS